MKKGALRASQAALITRGWRPFGAPPWPAWHKVEAGGQLPVGFLLGGEAYFLFGEPDYWQYGAMAGGMAGLIVGLLIANKRELDAKKKS